jgi:hypothetical protein
MGKKSGAIQIANAFSQHVFVKADANVVNYNYEHHSNTAMMQCNFTGCQFHNIL